MPTVWINGKPIECESFEINANLGGGTTEFMPVVKPGPVPTITIRWSSDMFRWMFPKRQPDTPPPAEGEVEQIDGDHVLIRVAVGHAPDQRVFGNWIDVRDWSDEEFLHHWQQFGYGVLRTLYREGDRICPTCGGTLQHPNMEDTGCPTCVL